jgi:hypothetical protein
MRKLTILIAMLIALPFAQHLFADEMSQGEMAGIIRSASYPCAKVLTVQSSGESSWAVECNSGRFHVSKNSDGQFSVSAIDGQ